MSSSVCKFGTQKSPQNITVTSSSDAAEMQSSVLTHVANDPNPKVSYVLVASLNASDFDTRFSLSSRFAWSILTRFACSASVNSRAFLPAFSSFNSTGWHTVDASSRQTKREPCVDERDGALVGDFDFDVPKFDDVAFAPRLPRFDDLSPERKVFMNLCMMMWLY